jgi:hypothetical protein
MIEWDIIEIIAFTVDNGKNIIKAVDGIEKIWYENINTDYDIDVVDFWRKYEKKFRLLSQGVKRIFCVQGARFDTNIERLSKLNR